MPKLCSICDTHNSHDSTICIKCGKLLDLETALKLEEKENVERHYVREEMQEMRKELTLIKSIRI